MSESSLRSVVKMRRRKKKWRFRRRRESLQFARVDVRTKSREEGKGGPPAALAPVSQSACSIWSQAREPSRRLIAAEINKTTASRDFLPRPSLFFSPALARSVYLSEVGPSSLNAQHSKQEHNTRRPTCLCGARQTRTSGRWCSPDRTGTSDLCISIHDHISRCMHLKFSIPSIHAVVFLSHVRVRGDCIDRLVP